MTGIRGSLDIARPVEEVFDTVADQRSGRRRRGLLGLDRHPHTNGAT